MLFFNLLVWPMWKLDGVWRMTVDYGKVYQMEAAAVQDIVSSLKKISIASGT